MNTDAFVTVASVCVLAIFVTVCVPLIVVSATDYVRERITRARERVALITHDPSTVLIAQPREAW